MRAGVGDLGEQRHRERGERWGQIPHWEVGVGAAHLTPQSARKRKRGRLPSQLRLVHSHTGPEQAQIAKMGKLDTRSLMAGMRRRLLCPFLPSPAPHTRRFQGIIPDKLLVFLPLLFRCRWSRRVENYSPCCCCYYYYLAVIPLTFFPGGRHKELLSCSQGHPTRKYQLFTSISFNYRAAENQITANLHYFMACLKCRTATFTPKHEQPQKVSTNPAGSRERMGGPLLSPDRLGEAPPFPFAHLVFRKRNFE